MEGIAPMRREPDPIEARRRAGDDSVITGGGGMAPSTEEFRAKHSASAAVIDQMIANLEAFGVDPDSVRLIEFEHDVTRAVAYQAVATLGGVVFKEFNDDRVYESPIEALHRLSLWLKQLLDEGRVKMPGELSTDVLYDARGNPMVDGMPDLS